MPRDGRTIRFRDNATYTEDTRRKWICFKMIHLIREMLGDVDGI